MAFIIHGKHFNSANIDFPVGRGAPNKHDDVALVQGLLITWTWLNTLSSWGSAGAKTFDINAFKLDGYFGHQTNVLLRTFAAAQRVSLKSPGWVMPMHAESVKSGNGRVVLPLGSDAMSTLLYETPAMLLGTDMFDTAHGKYQSYGVFCLGWHMPPLLAASLSRRRAQPLYHRVLAIDI